MALRIVVDDQRDEITIEGVRYSQALFRCVGIAPVGTALRIVRRQDGVLTVETLCAASSSTDAVTSPG